MRHDQADPRRVLATLLGVFPNPGGVPSAVRQNARLITSWLRSPDGMNLSGGDILRIHGAALSGDAVVDQLTDWLAQKPHCADLIVFISGHVGPLARPLLQTLRTASPGLDSFFIVDCLDGDQFVSEFLRSDRGAVLCASPDAAGRSILSDSQGFAAVMLDALRSGDSTKPKRVGLQGLHDGMSHSMSVRGTTRQSPQLLGQPDSLLTHPLFVNPTGSDIPPTVNAVPTPVPGVARPAPSDRIEDETATSSTALLARVGPLLAITLPVLAALALGVALSPWGGSSLASGSRVSSDVDAAACRAALDCMRAPEPGVSFERAPLEPTPRYEGPMAGSGLRPIRAPAPARRPTDLP